MFAMALVILTSCAKSAVNPEMTGTKSSTNTSYVIHMTVDNQSDAEAFFNVSYGIDNGSAQENPTPLTTTTYKSCSVSTQTFTVTNASTIYYLFVLTNPDLEIAIDNGNGTMLLYGDAYNLPMTAPTMNATIVVKNK